MSFGKNILNKTTLCNVTLPNITGVPFGTLFTPHMFNVDWTMKNGWTHPELIDFQNLSIPPQASGLHYALQCFEGLKAYCGTKGEIRLFRPDMNALRMQRSCARLCFPFFEVDDLIHGISELVKLDRDFIPKEKGYSLYIRPTAIATNSNLGVAAADAIKLYIITSPVGPYYASGFKPVKLMTDSKHKRTWPGGTGEYKIGANYAGSILRQRECAKLGFQQILWLGPGDVVDEVGAMNFMLLWKNKEGERELVTAPLDGTILPGVTRDTILSLARQWGEFKVTEKRFTTQDMVQASEEGRIEEAFGCGTAAIVTAVEGVQVANKYISVPVPEKSVAMRFMNAIQDIQYGVVEHSWSVVIP